MTTRTVDADQCVCGHSRAAHEHYRSGTDCGLCARGCPRFRRRGGRQHILNLMLQALHRDHRS